MINTEKLALAMGWTLSKEAPTGWIGEYPEAWWKSPSGNWNSHLSFDPFTDANDDYACLQFARERGNPLWTPFMHHCEGEQHQYEIGNWAKALLVAIEVIE